MKMHPSLSRRHSAPFLSSRLLAAAIALSVIASGCQNPKYSKGASTVAGILVGATTGYLAGGQKGAIIGGIAGGAAGFAVGQFIYDKQKDLETRKAVLAASIADATKVLNDNRAYNTYLEAQIQKVKDALQQITEAQAKGQITPEKARQMRQELVPGIDTMAQEAKQTTDTFKDYKSRLQSTTPIPTSAEYARQVEVGKELDQEIAKASKLLESLASQRNAAAGQ